MTKKVDKRLEFLRQQIAHHDALYYKQARPEISDYAYDQLKAELNALEVQLASSQVDLFDNIPASTPDVGDDRLESFSSRPHRQPMLSLDNTYDYADIEAFNDRLERLLGQKNLDYTVEPKMDGVAVSLTYEKGQFRWGLTRGNGVEGDDVTLNLRTLADIPHHLKGHFPDYVEIRGEIFLSYKEFERINTLQEEEGLEAYANPRNLAAGTLKQLDSRIVATRKLQFTPYGLGACEPAHFFKTQTSVLEAFKAWGFTTLSPFWKAEGLQGVWEAIEAIGKLRPTWPHGTDGAVIKLNLLALQAQAGTTAKAPRGLFAYKFAPEQAETLLEDIVLQVGRTGVLTPVAHLKPVFLAGSTISRATLHNADEIARKDIRVGDTVLIEKAGDVIPAVVGVIAEKRPHKSHPFEFPQTCPACHSRLIRLPEEVAWRCPNVNCPPQIERKLIHFGSKAAVDIENLGPATISLLLSQRLIHTLPDLYRLKAKDLVGQEGFAQKASENLIVALERSKTADLWRFIHGFGIPHIGAQTAKDIARAIPSWEDLPQLSAEDLQKIPGIGPIVAESWAAFWHQPENKSLLKELHHLGIAPTFPKSQGSALSGKIFVLTGTLPHWSREEAQAHIEAAGGKVSSSVSAKTSYVVAGAEAGSKLAKAQSLGVTILTEVDLKRLLNLH